jgi:glucokinase
VNNKPYVLGIDIGGSHITTALIDMDARRLVPGTRKRKLVDSKAGSGFILSRWCGMIEDTFNAFGIEERYVGLAFPGPFDYPTGVCLIKDQDKFNSLYGLNLKDELAARMNIPSENFRFINDAASFLQGEVFAGAAQAHRRVLGLTLGTGLGSALAIDGVSEDASLWNSPFRDGIAEDYLSSRWFIERYAQLTQKSIKGVKELAQLKNAGDVTVRIFSEFTHNLARFLAPVIKQTGAKSIIMGGNISSALSPYLPLLDQLLGQEGLPVNVELTRLKEDASLIGAASCWEDDLVHLKSK